MKAKMILILFGALWMASCAVTRPPEDIEFDRLKHARAVEAFRGGDFVLEADRLQNRRGDVVSVTSLANFISMRQGSVTVQTSFNNGRLGSNGLGGLTLEGRAGDIKTTTDKHGNLTTKMSVTGNFLSADVEVTLYAGSTRATATVSPTFSGNRLTLNGNIVPAEQSAVYKGQTPF